MAIFVFTVPSDSYECSGDTIVFFEHESRESAFLRLCELFEEGKKRDPKYPSVNIGGAILDMYWVKNQFSYNKRGRSCAEIVYYDESHLEANLFLLEDWVVPQLTNI